MLKDTVMEEWDKVIAAMKCFRYFDIWDDVAQRECCIRSKIKKYEADETVLGDGSGYQNYTYFLLKGQCVLVEHIFLKAEMKNGRKCYELLENGPEHEIHKEIVVGEEKVTKVSKISSDTHKRGMASPDDEPEEREHVRRYCKELFPVIEMLQIVIRLLKILRIFFVGLLRN